MRGRMPCKLTAQLTVVFFVLTASSPPAFACVSSMCPRNPDSRKAQVVQSSKPIEQIPAVAPVPNKKK